MLSDGLPQEGLRSIVREVLRFVVDIVELLKGLSNQEAHKALYDYAMQKMIRTVAHQMQVLASCCTCVLVCP